ncbi:MAG: ATP-binding protein [Lachnospiraceae bacterium]|nr:ATP-binding protein [Lachnospiraceae bacterium]
MSIIGRHIEQDVLFECVNSKRPEFLVVYGRRRVGKTFLVKEYFNDRFSFYATGLPNAKTRDQLRVFGQELIRYGSEEKKMPADWLEAFERLRKLLESGKTFCHPGAGKMIVFLDELPWMDTAKSDFRMALDYFWNSWGSSRKDLLLIVCGSATSWIMDHILNDAGGLYNRITRQLHLAPFTLRECETFLNYENEAVSKKQAMDFYMVFGGIPYYLNMFDRRLSVAQNIDMLVFDENGPLHYEYDILFRTLFKHAERYEALINAMAKRKSGVARNELIKDHGALQGSSLTKALKELEECHFIRKYRDFTKKSQECIYQIIDPFVLFCLNFVSDNRIQDWSSFMGSPGYYAWRGNAFEVLCFNHLPEIRAALGISGVSTQECAWRSRKSEPGVQIDLLIDRRDDIINVCEMKYSDGEYVIDRDYETKLNAKCRVFREETGTKKTVQLVLISAEGLKRNAHSDIVMQLVTGEDLFR